MAGNIPPSTNKRVWLSTLLSASLMVAACQKDASPPTDNKLTDTAEAVEGRADDDRAQTSQSTDETDDVSAEQKMSVVNLARYRWTLSAVKDARSHPLEALDTIKDQVTLLFNQYQGQNTLSYSVGCNTMSAVYQLEGHTLSTEESMSTKMLCDNLNEAENQLNQLMQGDSELKVTGESNPLLTQITSDNVTLMWRGRLTSQAKYNSKGETVFWAVNAQKVPCSANDSAHCLQVKPITYDDQGIKTGEGQWAPFAGEIDGYEHDGRHQEVLRLLRYPLKTGEVNTGEMATDSPAPSEKYAYVLDAVIESSVAQ